MTTTNNENFSQTEFRKDEEADVKKEIDLRIKPEPDECLVCSSRSLENYDVFTTSTIASGTLLHNFLTKLTNINLVYDPNNIKRVCKNCLDLMNDLEQAELEYVKLKQTFDDIISKSSLFGLQTQPIDLATVKEELFSNVIFGTQNEELDSEDEPLSVAKKKQPRKVDRRKKKPVTTSGRRKTQIKSNGDRVGGVSGGLVAETTDRGAAHSPQDHISVNTQVKTEDSADGSNSPHFKNGIDSLMDGEFKLEIDMFDEDDYDDDSSTYFPEDIPKTKTKSVRGPSKRVAAKKMTKKKTANKVMHQCDQCNAKYSTLKRLNLHKEKHDGSKPPYICEVCGASYKHKRACDIHIALHKGISDWKCEECNKLFPSKGALQRHNNIHTGKSNYQCDLCGKSFIHTSSFKMHKMAHSGLKPHSCDVCGLALMTRSHLKRHKRVHSGEKRHECLVCGKRFSERYNLAAHSKSHEATDANNEQPTQPQLPRRRLFRCVFCQERFERRYMLERHMNVVHGHALERPPPTPRNTMSKLLKAQAQRRAATAPPAPPLPVETVTLISHTPTPTEPEVKHDNSPERADTPAASASDGVTSVSALGSWATAPFSVQFAGRPFQN